MPKSRSRRKPTSRPTSGSRRTTPKTPLVPEPAPGVRGEVERRSAGLLLWLSARPKAFIPLLSVLLLIGGLAAPAGFGVPLLLLLVALVAWLSYLSWPVVAGVQKGVRLGTLGLVLAAIAGKLSG